jgi:hypothetical protein
VKNPHTDHASSSPAQPAAAGREAPPAGAAPGEDAVAGAAVDGASALDASAADGPARPAGGTAGGAATAAAPAAGVRASGTGAAGGRTAGGRPAPAPGRRGLAAGVLAAGLLGGLCVALVLTLRSGGTGYSARDAVLTGRYAVCWALFAGAVVALRFVPARWVAALVVAGGVAVAVTGLVAPPRTSTDSYRYAWDGRVQAAGVSPYDRAPGDPALARLRDPWLFPDAADCGRPGVSELDGGGCTRINRPGVHTVYPPAGELYFLLVHAVSPDHARHKALQAGGAGLAVGTTLLLLRVLRRRGDPRTAAYWAWCPAVPMEAVNNAHVDALAALLSVAALGLAVRRRGAGAGVLGVAVAAKLLPAVLLPGALSGVRRWRDAALTLGAAAGVVAALYVPYVLWSHYSVLGYLGGYAKEEGYDDAAAKQRYGLVRLVVPDAWAQGAVALGMAAVVALVLRRGDPARPWQGALTVTGTAFLLMTPGYSWYALLPAALVALDGRWEWLGVALAGAAAYLLSPDAGTWAYGLAALAVAAGALLRRTRRRGGGAPGQNAPRPSGVPLPVGLS